MLLGVWCLALGFHLGRYVNNKHIDVLKRDPTAVSGHYVDFAHGETLARALLSTHVCLTGCKPV